jgi:hypothetical protein
MWIWDVAKSDGGKIANIVRRCQQVGLGHVLIKTNDGIRDYNGTLKPLVSALKAAGVHVWAWQYTYGRAPQDEAVAFARRALTLSVNGVCVDAETEYASHPGAAVAYMEQLRSQVGPLPIALSSFYLPSDQPRFPWQQFLTKCDFAMPQVYWYMRDPASVLQDSWREYSQYINSRKIIPTGAAFSAGTGDATNIREFLAAAAQLGAGMVNFWSWQSATPAMWAQISATAGAQVPPGRTKGALRRGPSKKGRKT